MKYSVTTNEKLRSLCIKNDWFTQGTNRQYEKLFYANAACAPISDIVTIIWLCTDTSEGSKWCRKYIRDELEKAHAEYLRELEQEDDEQDYL